MSATAPQRPEDQPDFTALPSPSSPQGKRPLNICIASPDFLGLTRNEGSGVAYSAMAHALAAAGHHVTCLFLGPKETNSLDWQRWSDKYHSDGLTLVALPQINASELVAPTHLIKSYEAYHWLKRNDHFDIIHFPDHQGPGYHTLTAKHQGMAFARTTICIGLRNMTAWLNGDERDFAEDAGEVNTDFIERRTVALADAVVSSSQFLLNWIDENQWEMPTQRYVRQDVPPHSEGPAAPPVAPQLQSIDELVYFGTLETRKGLAVFCEALDSVPPAVAHKIKSVTFLGRRGVVDGVPAQTYIQEKSQPWAFPCQIIADLDEKQMMQYLRQPHRLAVIPSLLGNSACRILECLESRIAFVTSNVGGIPELIAPADVSKVCFEPTPAALAPVLCAALTEGIRPARAVLDAKASEQAWIELHENSLVRRPVPPVQPPVLRVVPPPAAATSRLPNETVNAAIQALSIDPDNVVALKALARIYLNAGLFDPAEEVCQLILTREAGDEEALQMLLEATMQETRWKEKMLDQISAARSPSEFPCQPPYPARVPPAPVPAALP